MDKSEQLEVTQADRDAATKKWEDVARHNYQAGNALFRDLRAFLDSANLDPSRAKLIIELPTESERSTLVKALQYSSPPISEFSRTSSAQAGNYGGMWQGVAYEFTVQHSAIQSTEAHVAESVEWQDISTAPVDEPILAAITVTNNKSGRTWIERHIICIDSETGEIQDADYDHGWPAQDYEYWHPLPAPPKEDS